MKERYRSVLVDGSLCDYEWFSGELQGTLGEKPRAPNHHPAHHCTKGGHVVQQE